MILELQDINLSNTPPEGVEFAVIVKIDSSSNYQDVCVRLNDPEACEGVTWVGQLSGDYFRAVNNYIDNLNGLELSIRSLVDETIPKGEIRYLHFTLES